MLRRPVFELPTIPTSTAVKIGIGIGALASLGAAYCYSRMCSRREGLPSPGPSKRNPKKLDEIHDRAVEDSMAVSDPPSTIMPEVRR